MTEPLVYLNDRQVPASAAALPIYDAGIVQGATVTEMTRTFHCQPWRLDAHLDRLFRSLRYTRIDIGLSKERLTAISHELIAHNAGLLDPGDELGLIHFVTAGAYPTYAGMLGMPVPATPTVCVHTYPLPYALWARKMQKGAHVVTPSIRHVPPQCYDPKMKYRSRMHFYLADQEARLVDPEAIALLLDLDGNLTETNAANFLLVQDGTVLSPTTRNTLPGVSRAMVIELCARLGIPFVERDLQVYHALTADEAFLASTPYCLMPVTRVNGVSIGSGVPGPVYGRLLGAWSEAVGLDIQQQILDGAARQRRVAEASEATR
jgi:branched-subunit amino acid aminotransferase/4-amino-4-deoxychorismate lyase